MCQKNQSELDNMLAFLPQLKTQNERILVIGEIASFKY
ncbi:hypothetical protein L313_1991 [Acinetobacter haemolyticus CIP 64.3 = MTCC 9819]|nr:hypothetical protein L313_1991 [Acinetobacter haemolyticus CIP 64.3 = MTCC 9819]